MKFYKNYSKAEEKYVKTVTLYGKKGDSYVYADEACTTKVAGDELKNLFVKGLAQIQYEGAIHAPVCIKEDADKGCQDITIWDALATTPAAVTLHSAEYTA